MMWCNSIPATITYMKKKRKRKTRNPIARNLRVHKPKVIPNKKRKLLAQDRTSYTSILREY